MRQTTISFIVLGFLVLGPGAAPAVDMNYIQGNPGDPVIWVTPSGAPGTGETAHPWSSMLFLPYVTNPGDGSTFTLDDGHGTTRTFEIKATPGHVVAPGNIEVDITEPIGYGGGIAAYVVGAVNGEKDLKIRASNAYTGGDRFLEFSADSPFSSLTSPDFEVTGPFANTHWINRPRPTTFWQGLQDGTNSLYPHAFPDGAWIDVSVGGVTTRFEFDDDNSVAGVNVPVELTSSMTWIEAQLKAAKVITDNLDVYAHADSPAAIIIYGATHVDADLSFFEEADGIMSKAIASVPLIGDPANVQWALDNVAEDGTVLLRAGTFEFNEGRVEAKRSVEIRGETQGATLLTKIQDGFIPILGNTDLLEIDLAVRDLHFDGYRYSPVYATGGTFAFTGNRVEHGRGWEDPSGGYWQYGILVTEYSALYSWGVWGFTRFHEIVIDDNEMYGPSYDHYGEYPHFVTFDAGIGVVDIYDEPGKEPMIYIRNNRVYFPGNLGLWLAGFGANSTMWVEGNEVHQSPTGYQYTGNPPAGWGDGMDIYVHILNSQNGTALIADNEFYDCYGSAMYLSSIRDAIVNNNAMTVSQPFFDWYNEWANGILAGDVTNSVFKSNTVTLDPSLGVPYAGLNAVGLNECTLRQNKITGVGVYGILDVFSSDQTYVGNNLSTLDPYGMHLVFYETYNNNYVGSSHSIFFFDGGTDSTITGTGPVAGALTQDETNAINDAVQRTMELRQAFKH